MIKKRLGTDPFERGQAEKVIDILTKAPAKAEKPKAKGKPGLKRKPGRPITITRTMTKSSQEGLPEGWTRASFIIQETVLEKLKDYAYTDRRQIKEVVTEALENYLKNKKIINRRS
ncbi:MAG: hypothetical protein BWX78_01439 [Firmicutes bacterium ADurb.Bin099]|nr:MAG: hypothetical protein BWX78_01439 [Firmicutes bacterium ADurb.Bin099]